MVRHIDENLYLYAQVASKRVNVLYSHAAVEPEAYPAAGNNAVPEIG